MKIMHVIHGFPPHNNAGAEIYHYNLAREQARDNKVAVFCRYADEGAPEYAVADERFDGLQVRRINNTLRDCKSYEEIYTNPPIAAAFAKFLDEFRPDVVHIGHLTYLSTIIVDEIAKRGIPRVMTLHDFWMLCLRGQLLDENLEICAEPLSAACERCHPMRVHVAKNSKAIRFVNALPLGARLKRALTNATIGVIARLNGKRDELDCVGQVAQRRKTLQAVLDKIDLFIAPSESLRDVFVANGIAPSRIIYLDNGQDVSHFENFRRAPSDKIRFGFTGSIIPSKGLHVLLDAFRGIEPGRAELNVFGDFGKSDEHADYPEKIKRLAAAPGIEMRGRYLPEEVARIFAEIDVLVVPSMWYELHPLVIMEAYMSGAPVIASNLGGMAEIVRDGENGLLFEPGDASSLRTAMRKILDDPSLIGRFAEHAPRVKTIAQNAAEVMEAYGRVSGGATR